MNSSTIEQLLQARGAWLKSTKGDDQAALARASFSRSIAGNYAEFERQRDEVLHLGKLEDSKAIEAKLAEPEISAFVAKMAAVGLISDAQGAPFWVDGRLRRYLSGGWLEEFAWLAAMEAGAHEAIHGQVLGWEVNGFSGENEIDLIMRFENKLSFVSCKALRSELDANDRKHRNRLMDAVHTADNLADHFGRQGEKVAVLVTTDLYDEVKDTPRYHALMGKAAVLDVRIIALEDLAEQKLVKALRALMMEN